MNMDTELADTAALWLAHLLMRFCARMALFPAFAVWPQTHSFLNEK